LVRRNWSGRGRGNDEKSDIVASKEGEGRGAKRAQNRKKKKKKGDHPWRGQGKKEKKGSSQEGGEKGVRSERKYAKGAWMLREKKREWKKERLREESLLERGRKKSGSPKKYL